MQQVNEASPQHTGFTPELRALVKTFFRDAPFSPPKNYFLPKIEFLMGKS